MDIIECIRSRKSIRGYKEDPVPKQVIMEILGVSIYSPSGLNTQPWEFLIVTGDVLDNIKKDTIEKYTSGTMPGLGGSGHKHQGVYKQRQVALAKQLFGLMNIGREDHAKREEWMKKGIRFFDSPAAIIVTMDEAVSGKFALFDLGIVTQTICLVAHSYGLGTCIEMQGVLYPEVIYKHTRLPESKQIIIGIAIGYPDWDFPANHVKSDRVPAEEISTWMGFYE